ncbi:MAG TPA: hypothetical protein VD931_18030 [Baekduia sp.]|nr:hypothetical protein [Baekduia sp.]
MRNLGSLGLPTGVAGLVLGLVVGALGSFTDDALGGATAVTILQIALWALGGLLVVPALSGLLGGAPRGGGHHRRPHPTH